MKIIDLLNKIANGEEVPQKIKVGNKIYNYETFNIGKGDNYFTAEWEKVKGYRISYDGTYYYLEIRDYSLNEEIEILEEENRIPEKLEEFGLIQYNLDYIDYKNIETLKEWLNKDFQTIYDALDLIIKNQNKLIDYLKSKGE